MAKLPVLDDNTVDAMVLGWATNRAGAMRIVLRRAKEDRHTGYAYDVSVQPVHLNQNEDLHLPGEAARVNRIGRGWVLEQTRL